MTADDPSPGLRVFQSGVVANPHDTDALAGDLDAVYAGTDMFRDQIDWGAFLKFNGRWTPEEVVLVGGPDWDLSFLPSGAGRIPGDPRVLDFPIATVVVRASVSGSPNEARDIGRPRIWRVLSMLLPRLPQLWRQQFLWEGPIAADSRLPHRAGFATGGLETETVSPTRLRDVTERLWGRPVGDWSPALSLAARWYGQAWQHAAPIDQWMSYWLAALALVEQASEASQKKRIETYVTDLQSRSVFSAARRQLLLKVLNEAYDLRNRVFHESDVTAITPDAVRSLDYAVSFCIEQEMLTSRAP